MQDNEKLVERLKDHAERGDSPVAYEAAWTIEAQAREIAALKLTNAAIVQQSQIVARSDERTRTQLTETQARLAEAVGLLAEVFADNGKLNSLTWMDATAGVIAKQEGA